MCFVLHCSSTKHSHFDFCAVLNRAVLRLYSTFRWPFWRWCLPASTSRTKKSRALPLIFFFHYAWLVSDYAWRCLTVRLSSLWQSWPKLWSLSNFNEFYVCSIMLPVFLIIFSCTFKECFSYLSKVLNINFANLNLKASTSRITWSSRSSRSSSPDEPTASAVCSLAHAHPGSVESTWNRRNKERNLRRIFLRVKTVTFFFLYTKNVRIQYT